MNRSLLKTSKRKGLSLFFMILPLLIIVFLLSYLPLYGWVYAFFDYKPGLRLSQCEFVGLKHFLVMFSDPYSAAEVARVLINTISMSFLGILTSPLPMIMAIMLNEVKFKPFKKVVQTLSTMPNFISWILVYAVAFAMFSVGDGFVNRLLLQFNITDTPINFLASDELVWIKMLLWNTWKTMGWNAIIYIAAISGIDQQLYEAATVDGANRMHCIWHVTVPSLLSTYFVLLLLSIANFVNSGMEQYYVFQNAMTKSSIEVLDLYVYNLGIIGRNYSFSTAIGILKSVTSILLLFFANFLSKTTRNGESII